MNVRDRVEKIISDELNNAGVTTEWSMDEIHVLPESNIVIEYSSSKGTLSQALINHYFPPILDISKQAHFTTLDKFRSILNSNSLRLYALEKRLNEQEFKPFSEDFGLTGYLDDSNGEPYYKTLSRELFYTSFTNTTPTDESYLWNIFGARGGGIKIVFELSVKELCSELRPVKYQTSSQAASAMIKTINERIQKESGRHFIMRGISRVGAFYLPLGFGLEKEEETRLLVKSWGEGPAHDLIENDGQYTYIPLTLGLGNNPFCNLSIIEVQAGEKCSKGEVEKLLNEHDLSNIKVSKYFPK